MKTAKPHLDTTIAKTEESIRIDLQTRQEKQKAFAVKFMQLKEKNEVLQRTLGNNLFIISNLHALVKDITEDHEALCLLEYTLEGYQKFQKAQIQDQSDLSGASNRLDAKIIYITTIRTNAEKEFKQFLDAHQALLGLVSTVNSKENGVDEEWMVKQHALIEAQMRKCQQRTENMSEVLSGELSGVNVGHTPNTEMGLTPSTKPISRGFVEVAHSGSSPSQARY